MRSGPTLILLALAALSAATAAPAQPMSPAPPAPASTPAPAAAPAPLPAPAVEIESFSPEGYVRDVRQVTVRFTAPVVALGDPRLEDPFRVQCPAPGSGRWADPRTWVYDFDADLPAGVRCRFTRKSSLTAASGTRVTGRSVFSFHTGGPAIRASLPIDGWRELDEEQVFLLRLDAPATAASIEAHAWCAIDGIVERIPVVILTGANRQTVLDERRVLGYQAFDLLWKNGARTRARVRDRSMAQDEERITVLRCARRLPPATSVFLHWGAGIATPSGLLTEADQQLAFRVRPAFTAQVECTRSNPRAGCIPTQPIDVVFSAPVPEALALAIRMQLPDGRTLTPTGRSAPAAPPADKQTQPMIDRVSFAPPFPESAQVTVSMPAGLIDDAGRPLENGARFPLALRIDPFAPLIKFSGTFGILESREGGVLPVTVRNVEPRLSAAAASIPGRLLRVGTDAGTIVSWLNRVDASQASSGNWENADEAIASGRLKPKLEDAEDEDDEESSGRPRQVWRETTGARSIFDQPISEPRPSGQGAGSDQRAGAGQGAESRAFTLEPPLGPKPEQVIGIPLKRPGFYVVEIASPLLGAALLGPNSTRYVATAALVTDLAVHFEWGRESSLVWVTRLGDGTPVADAEVAVSNFCTGATLWQGRTDQRGIATIAESLGEPGQGGCPWRAPLFVLAKKGDDVSFTESTWARGITPFEFGLPVGSGYTAEIYHTVLDRALYRAGETVSMKHFIRRHVSSGIDVPPGSGGTHSIQILHEGSGQRFTLSADFDPNGVATSAWPIPAEAKLGTYHITIDGRPSGQFKVEQFRLPAMRAQISGPPRPLVAPREVELDLHLAYLSGGGAGGAPVKIRTQIEPEAAHLDGYPDYRFGGAPVQEGITSSANTPLDVDFESGPAAADASRTQTLPVTLDATGSKRVTIGSLSAVTGDARLTAELEYADPNGEIMTASALVHLVPAAVRLGIRPESWVGSPGQMRFRVLVVDLDGKPSAHQPVVASLYRSTAYSYRKRLLGGFYAYETTTDTEKLAVACSGTTNEQGLLLCDLAPGVSGQIIVRAETRDAGGATAGATTSMWVIDHSQWWFGGTSGDRMDLLPEKKEYEAGDTARFQVRMPFRRATALVSVEREGVLRAFVTELKGDAPIIEVPIEAADAPDVFVSVLAVRGRVGRPDGGGRPQREAVTALVDLTKPAYRLGAAQIKVGWRPHRLEVRVTPARKLYTVRDHARIDIAVTRDDGGALPPGTEVALAAVDEALLDLAPNGSWNLLEAMMGERGLEVWTSTGQMQVLGKRHYGRKAVPQGGGGGRELDRARELFDSLLFWQPRIALDASGHAEVEVPLNDSLSAFRLVAVAQGGAAFFGTGMSTINTTQDLILLSGLPPLVREGDRYQATFTVRNTTDHALTAVLHAAAGNGVAPLPAQQAGIPAGASHDFTWTLTAPVGASSIDWDVAAATLGGGARDRLKVKEQVEPAFPVRTYQATIAQLTAPLALPVEIPRGAIAGRGGLEITLESKLASHIDGVREYMQLYPYVCLEQQASRAVVFRSRSDWDAVMARLPAYMDEDGLLKYFPSDRLRGDDGLTAYILSIGAAAGYPIDSTDRSRMLEALRRFVEGRIIRDSALPTADLAIRKLQALDALSRYHAATASMLDSIHLEANLMPTSTLLDWIGVLERTPGVPDAEQKIKQSFGLLRARLNFQGTVMSFSTERSDALWWLMISSDSNANRMLLATLERPEWREDVPRLVRGALGRLQFGHWNTTVANAWGVLALEKFSAAFESTPVAGSTAIHYGGQDRDIAWPAPPTLPSSRAALAPDDPAAHADDVSVTHLDWQHGRGELTLTHLGRGAPWAMVRATAALPLERPLSSGFKVARTLTPVEQHRPGSWTRGDVLRVHLELEAQSDMSWVVIDDPIPAGAVVLGSGLGGESGLLQQGERRSGWAWLAYEERRFDAYRAYYRFVPKGHWSIDYTVRLNNPGTFLMPATRIEAMYAPEMFGEVPNDPVTVEAADPTAAASPASTAPTPSAAAAGPTRSAASTSSAAIGAAP